MLTLHKDINLSVHLDKMLYLRSAGVCSPLNVGGIPIDRSLFMDTQLGSDGFDL